MGWNGSGQVVRTDGVRTGSDVAAQQKIAGIKVRSDLHDTEMEDLATAIELCVTRDGQNSPSANLPMNSFKHTGVTAASGGSSRTEYASGGTVQDGAIWDAGDTGNTATAFTAVLSPAITAYANKQLFRVKFHAAFGATPTINFNTVGAKKMYYMVGSTATQLTTNDVPQNYVAILRYDTSLDSAAGAFLVLNPPTALFTAAYAPLAGATFTGAINEAQGADIASAGTLNLDTATGNLVDVTGTTTITAITLSQGRERTVRFTGALTLTHGASLVLPGAANIVTVAGDFAVFRGYAAGVVRCESYTRGALAPGSLGSDLGQCRLTKSGSNLQLDRFNGSKLFINGTFESIPSAGVTLAPTSSTQDTTYYIYAYMSTGTMTLEYSTTAPTADTTYGHQIKTGDATRTLVGMARTITGPAWVDTDAQRYVLSHFNRRGIVGKSALTANRTSTSATYAEINSEIRVEFITWADEVVVASADGPILHSATGSTVDTSIGFDGTTAEETMSRFQAYTNSAQGGFGLCLPKTGLAVGYHYATLLGRTSGATATWTDAGGAGERCSLKIMVQG